MLRLFPGSVHCRISLIFDWKHMNNSAFMGLRWWKKHLDEAWQKRPPLHPYIRSPILLLSSIHQSGSHWQNSSRWTMCNLWAHAEEKAVRLEWIYRVHKFVSGEAFGWHPASIKECKSKLSVLMPPS